MDYSSYSKDPDYYFPDGSLCLAVEQKLFKIHSGVLARHSTVFCDMLSVPPLADTGGEQYEAVPVVRLEDEAKDIWVLLSVTYDPPPNAQEITFDVIDSVLRIAHKYDFIKYQVWGITWLQELYPSADDGMEIVYGHSNWLSYHSPRFLIRLIHLTELLDRRELDGVAALAQYALPNVSRGGIYESDIVDRLQRAAIMRIITSQHRFHTHCTSVIIRITEHECYAQEPQRHTSRACRSHKKVILIALTSALNRDFIAALRKLRGGMLDSCRVLEEIVSAEALKLFTLIPREFGVQRITKEPAGK